MDDSRIESQIINSLIFKSSPAYYVWTGLYLHSKHRHCSQCAIKIKIITVSSTHLSGDWRHFGSFFISISRNPAQRPLSHCGVWTCDILISVDTELLNGAKTGRKQEILVKQSSPLSCVKFPPSGNCKVSEGACCWLLDIVDISVSATLCRYPAISR